MHRVAGNSPTRALISDRSLQRSYNCPVTSSEDKAPIGNGSAKPTIEAAIERLVLDSDSGKVPDLSTVPASQPIDFTRMGNPFAKIPHTGDPSVVRELVCRTTVESILRIEGDTAWSLRAVPIDGLDPFDVLTLVDASDNQAKETVTSYSQQLCKLFAQVNDKRFNSLCNHLLPKEKKIRCMICSKSLKTGDATKLLEHIMSGAHVDTMRRLKLVYSLEAVVFWMYALQIAQKDASWWLPEENKVKKEVAIANVKKTSVRRQKLVGSGTNYREEVLLTQLEEQYKRKAEAVAKIGEAVKREKQKQNQPIESKPPRALSLFDILSTNISLIKNPFDEIAHPGDATVMKELLYRTANKRILRFEQNRLFPIDGIDPLDIFRPIPVKNGKVEDAVWVYTLKLRELLFGQPKGLFNLLVTHLLVKNKTYCCSVCSCWISSEYASNLLHHIIQKAHVDKMQQNNLAYPLEALAFWMHALNITHKNKTEL